MKAHIYPSVCHGRVTIPPSKSMAHRAIICASLANGTSTITNISYSKDILATIDCMSALGATIYKQEDGLQITGISSFHHPNKTTIFCNESGSTLRFLIPLFSLTEQTITFTGAGRLLQRPLTLYKDIFHQQGLDFDQEEDHLTIHQALHADEFSIPGNISSQFISGLLFTLPLLKEESILHIEPPFESSSYVSLTIQMLQRYGITIHQEDAYTFRIPGNQQYEPYDYRVEGDYSQFAFFAVLAAISNTLTIQGVDLQSQQGDQEILSILSSFGTKMKAVEHGYTIYKSELKGQEIDLSNCPDLGPILCVLAMYSQGNTHISHANRLRIKESDRIQAMEDELHKFGVTMHSTEDDIYITGSKQPTCQEALSSHNDHRIVMALTVALLCGTKDAWIFDAEAISKSYPNFFDDIASIGGKVELV